MRVGKETGGEGRGRKGKRRRERVLHLFVAEHQSPKLKQL